MGLLWQAPIRQTPTPTRGALGPHRLRPGALSHVQATLVGAQQPQVGPQILKELASRS